MMREQRAEYLRMKSVSVYVSIAGITANYSGAEVFKLADIADTVYTRLQIVSVDKSKRCIAESEYIPNYTDCAVSACAVDNISVADSSDFADCLDTTESATSVYSADSVGVADSFCTADSRSIADLADFADSVDFANASNSTNTVDLALCDSAFTDDVNPTDTADVSPTDTADVSPTDTADVSPTDTAEGTTHTDTADVTPTDSSDGTTPTESADGISPTDATYITPADYTDDINPADDTPADVADGTTPADVADGTTPGDSTFTIANDTECADDGTAMLKINSSKFTSLHDAAVLVQSCWRGVLARRVVSQLRCPHSDHLQLIIERLRCFTISLGQQLSAINQLYNLTESNSCCCWALCHHPEGLYTLLQLLANGNRSQPETQLAKINLSVLVHVATVKHCAGRLLQCNGWLDIVLTAMVRHCRCSQLVSLCCRLLLHAISYRPLIKQELYGRHRWRQLLQKWYSEAVRQEKKLKPQPSDSSVTLMNSSTVSQNSHADVHTSSVLLHRLLTTLQHAN